MNLLFHCLCNPVTLLTISVVLVKISASVDQKTISGKPVGKNEHPYAVYFKYDGDMVCGGSLIHESWVLTLASCVNNRWNEALYRVYVGDRKTRIQDGEVVFMVEQIVSVGAVTMLKLAAPVNTSLDHVGIAQYADNGIQGPDRGTSCLVVAFGKGSKTKHVTTGIIGRSTGCTGGEPETFCFEGSRVDSKMCKGDEGSPVMCQLNGGNTYTQVGIIMDSTCSGNRGPAVNISTYIGFMEDTIQERGYASTGDVDGGWTNWGAWGGCSATCDVGIQRRGRNCTNPAPSGLGRECEGDYRDERICTTSACNDGGWSGWGSWGACSSSCGDGLRSRDRSCTNPSPSLTGAYCLGSPMKVEPCNEGRCKAADLWSTWGAWSSCSLTCGSGVTTRFRTCDSPSLSSTGRACVGNPMEADSCKVASCPGASAVGFSAYFPGESTVPNQIKFDVVLTNDGGGYDSKTGVFTTPVAGLYFFTTTLLKSYSRDGHARCKILHEGRFIADAYIAPGHSPAKGNYAAVASVYVKLAAGDKVTLAQCTPITPTFSWTSAYSGFLVTADVSVT